MCRKSCDIHNLLNSPASLKLQIMNRKYGFDSRIKIIISKYRMQKHRNKSCLPVIAMDNIRGKINIRQTSKYCLGKICKLFHIFIDIVVWRFSCKIKFIVHKIKVNTMIFRLENSNILPAPVQIYIKMAQKF